MFDVSNPSQPVRLAEFRPQGTTPGAVDRQLGVTPTMTWSYPIVRDGLIYVADINQGLYVLRYSGPRQEQLEQVAFAEGNSDLAATLPASSATTVPLATPTLLAPTAGAGRSPTPLPTIAVVVVGLLLVGAIVAVGRLRRRGR